MENKRFRTPFKLFSWRKELAIEGGKVTVFRRFIPFIGNFTHELGRFDASKAIYGFDGSMAENSGALFMVEDVEQTEAIDPADLDADAKMKKPHKGFALPFRANQIQQICLMIEPAAKEKGILRKAGRSSFAAVSDKWLMHLPSIGKVNAVPIEHMAFFSKAGKKIYCGYHSQLSMKVSGASTRSEIEGICKKKSRRLSGSGNSYSKGWLTKESITLTDEAVVFNSEKFSLFRKAKSETTYVPYERIGFAAFVGKKFRLFGEQNIESKKKFCSSDRGSIADTIKSKAPNIDSGESFSTTGLRYEIFGGAPTLVCTKERVLYFPNKLEKKKFGKVKLATVSLNYDDISLVTKYRERGFFKKTGVVIQGVPRNIRSDQSAKSVSMAVPKISDYSGLKSILEQKGVDDFERIKKSLNI